MSASSETSPARLPRLAGLALALCLVGGGLAAQGEREEPRGSSARDLARVLSDRDRERLHPGEPLTIVGIEQGDNEFRSRTPLLEQSDRAIVYVDEEENHERQMALYGSRARFSSPPATTAVRRPDTSSDVRPSPGPRREEGPSEVVSSGSSWVLGLPLVLLGVMWLVYRKRGFGTA